jgi:outer membrane protein OmpA-like peptidoglycan-associated protein/tetratricopeptide (TPR) repeat protein
MKSSLYLKHAILAFLSICLFVTVIAQDTKKLQKEILNQGLYALDIEDYEGAQRLFRQLVELDYKNASYHFYEGISYFLAPSNKEASLKPFEASLANSFNDTIPELFYYLGRSYQLNHEFDKAIIYYNKSKSLVKNNKSGKALALELDYLIKTCQHGTYHASLTTQNPVETKLGTSKNKNKYYINSYDWVILENLGNKINSSFRDVAPIIYANGNVILFTTRRNLPGNADDKKDDSQYAENVMVTINKDGRWTDPVEVQFSGLFNNSLSNSPSYESLIMIAYDEKELFYYRDNIIYSSQFTNGQWTEIKPLNSNINSKKIRASSVFLSPDNSTLYVAATIKKNGYGGKDIYISKRMEDGEWGELQNIGPVINTEHDEDAPFITKDGKKLYFASKGHSSIGGYDIFVSEWKNDTWDTPRSLGIPINTPLDEIYYWTDEKEKFTLYSSSRDGGYGDMDIYRIEKGADPRPVLADKKEVVKDTSKVHFDTPTDKVIAKEEKKELVKVVEDEIAVVTKTESIEDTVNETNEKVEIKKDEVAENKEEVKTKVETPVVKESIKVDTKEIVEIKKDEIAENKEEVKTKVETPIVKETPKTETNDKVTTPTETKTPETVKETPKTELTELKPADEVKVVKEEKTTVSPTPKTPSKVAQEMLANLEFGFNASQLSDDNKNQLNQLLAYLKENPNSVLQIDGHTDHLGSSEVNMAVSRQRAMLIFDYLINNGADVYRVNYDYFGKEKPLVSNTNPDGSDNPENRAKNRRAELDITDHKLFRAVTFGFDSYTLSADAKKILDEIAEFIAKNPNVKVDMKGFTDSVGNPAYNKELSRKRVHAAKEYLAGKGVNGNAINIGFFGPDKPTIPNTTDKNRQYNRRVEIRID